MAADLHVVDGEMADLQRKRRGRRSRHGARAISPSRCAARFLVLSREAEHKTLAPRDSIARAGERVSWGRSRNDCASKVRAMLSARGHLSTACNVAASARLEEPQVTDDDLEMG